MIESGQSEFLFICQLIISQIILLTVCSYLFNTQMFLVFHFLSSLLILVACDPELLKISSKNECIKSIVSSFVRSSTCDRLLEKTKSQLALKMTNCLFLQMGKNQIICKSPELCDLHGDSWNTFATFYAHIDNLCHFYWQISRAERSEQMIDALLTSAEKTQESILKNNENTKQILQLQTTLRIQILNSIATQQQMSQILNKSSIAINTLTSDISESLNKIHSDIDQHYAIVSKILSAINQVLNHLDSLNQYLVAEARSIQGTLFFVGFTLLILIGCIFSEKIRRRRNQCLTLISCHFILQFFFSPQIGLVLGIQLMRSMSLLVIALLILSSREAKSPIEHALQIQLNSQRIRRIMANAMKKEMYMQVPRIKALNSARLKTIC